jgi:hypothetical protein
MSSPSESQVSIYTVRSDVQPLDGLLQQNGYMINLFLHNAIFHLLIDSLLSSLLLVI